MKVGSNICTSARSQSPAFKAIIKLENEKEFEERAKNKLPKTKGGKPCDFMDWFEAFNKKFAEQTKDSDAEITITPGFISSIKSGKDEWQINPYSLKYLCLLAEILPKKKDFKEGKYKPDTSLFLQHMAVIEKRSNPESFVFRDAYNKLDKKEETDEQAE